MKGIIIALFAIAALFATLILVVPLLDSYVVKHSTSQSATPLPFSDSPTQTPLQAPTPNLSSSPLSPTPSDTFMPSPSLEPLTSPAATPSITPTPTLAPIRTPVPTPTEPVVTFNDKTQEELLRYALSLINADRQSSGLQNVTLSAVNSAQIHADEMLKNGYFSHWDMNGYKPYMRYTLAGGEGAVSENVAWQYQRGNIFGIDVKSALKELEWSMMYNDASSNWGHRDNILDALHNRVSIGIAYDRHNVYFVEDFENAYISWDTLNVNNNQTTMQGTIQKEQTDIKQIAIFYDNTTYLTPIQLSQAPYQGSYNAGTYVGLALPTGWKAAEGITITADEWIQDGNDFQISFSLSQAVAACGKGIYTIYVETSSSTADSLLTYSIWIN